MASGEQPNPLKCRAITSTACLPRHDSESQWLLPNNLELSCRVKPSKKQRNKEKLRHFQKGSLLAEIADGLPCKAAPFHNFPQVKCNTTTWLKDQFINDDKSKRRAYDSEEVFSDSDLPLTQQQNVNFPANQTFSDLENHEHDVHLSQGVVESDNIKSIKDDLQKRETAIVCEILSHIQHFISEAESSWQQLDLSDEPIIKDAFVKLKNAVKDFEGNRENKLMLHHLASVNGFANGVSPSSSTSRISNSKENVANKDSSGNAIHCNEDEQTKCNQLHEIKVSDERGESTSSGDSSIADVGERVAAVEWERRKLKNKLVELQEEKKIKDELLRELGYLKDAANIASSITPQQRAKDKKKKKISKYPSPCQSLIVLSKGVKGISEDDAQLLESIKNQSPACGPPRHLRSATSVKRDNVRKEQNSAFPARRHYEAEGRANEDPDIPGASAPVPSPAVDTPEIQDKIRKLKVAQEHVKVLKDIVASILESQKSGSDIPVEQLRHLAPLQRHDQYFSDDSEEDSDVAREFPPTTYSGGIEGATSNVKEISSDGLKTALDVDSQKMEDAEKVIPGSLESVVGKKGDLTLLQTQFQQLLQVFPSSDHKNDDPVRSSGEGAYTQKKNPSNVVSGSIKRNPRTVPMQDNLQLTRQNIVSVESQNQNPNSNIHNRDCNSVKKDNINNLSGKMGKLSIQNSMNTSYPDMLTGSNNNMDTMSTFSYELNQNHSLPNEIERKTILDILKKDKKKQKQYEINQDSKMCCNSSIDSEPLEGSNSALALDSTAVAAWCGSSTQENFEDENEHAESLDQDDEEESASVFDKGSLRAHGSASQYSSQYSNMQHYMESVANIPDKRQTNFHHPIYSRNQNQSVGQTECQQHPAHALKSIRRTMPSPNTASGLPRDLRNASSCLADNTEHCNQHPSIKFIQQLKNHIDQINALCQNQVLHDRTQSALNCPQSYRLPNACTPFQPTSEMGLPSNEQLLLCLSQCYHTLYIQQLEIQHLQHCMWHNVGTENSQQQNNLNSRFNHDDPNFRPFTVPSWPNPLIPSGHFPPDVSPMSSAPYYHLPMKAYPAHVNGMYGSASGAPPARAVIHPTSQNNAASQQTLNNQVPPRTRANNFWDNFRSYSRQNLLSTSNNTKRNENASSLVTPQVRQVYPLVTNDSPNRSTDISNAYGNATSFSDYNRSPPISDMQTFTATIPKKPKSPTNQNMRIAATLPTKTKSPPNPDIIRTATISKRARSNTPASSSNCSHKNDVPPAVAYFGFPTVRSGKCRKLSLEHSIIPLVSNVTSDANQQQSVQDNSKLVICQSSVKQADQETPVLNGTSELPTAASEVQSDFLTGLFHEAQSLKSDALRQKALKVIRDLAKSENPDSESTSQTKCLTHTVQDTIPGSTTRVLPVETPILSSEVHEIDRTQMLSDTASGNVQNLPTAAIQPLSKHGTPRAVCTGAVRKKPKTPIVCSSEPISSPASQDSGVSAAENSDSPAVIPQTKAIEDVPGFITEKVLSDLVAMLPSLKRRLLRDGCSQTFWTFINDCVVEGIRSHLFNCNINLTRKSLLHLRQNVFFFISLFSGIAVFDIDSDFLKCVEEFVYENMIYFVSSGQFPPGPSSTDEENSSMGIEDKMCEFDMKSSLEECVQMKELSIKMPLEESDAFSPQCGTISQQNLLQNLCSFENFISEPAIEQDGVGQVSDDVGCGCNPEAEIEPEVEIGTEADLAEADQSPGQQGTVSDGFPATESWSADQDTVLNRNSANSGAITLDDDSRDIENSSDGATGSQCFPDACLDQEAVLDDIPIKLCPSEEELPQQLIDELPVQLPSDDMDTYSEFISDNSGDGASSNLR